MRKPNQKLCVMFIVLMPLLAFAEVKINEFMPKGSEWIELYNSGYSSISLSGWKISDKSGNIVVLNGSLDSCDYDTVASDMLDNGGDLIFLINSGGDTVDKVGYGNEGGAPLCQQGFSTGRITDGFNSGNDAADFNIDGTPTPGAMNDMPDVSPGSSVIINEIDPYPDSGGDSVEIFNPTSGIINLSGWFLGDGDYISQIITDVSISCGGHAVLVEDIDWSGGVEFCSSDVCYLFNPDTVRVDQLGWEGESNDFSFQRSPDGEGPNDGYNWSSSGGDVHLFDTLQTWGMENGNYTGINEDVFFKEEKFSVEYREKGKIFITYCLKKPSCLRISLYDLSGRKLNEISKKGLTEGMHEEIIRTDNLKPGILFLSADISGRLIKDKILIIR